MTQFYNHLLVVLIQFNKNNELK